MGKIDEYASGRNDGLQLALKIVEEAGVDALREEIKFRGAKGINTAMSKKELNKACTKIKEMTLDTMLTLSVATLHDEFDFGLDGKSWYYVFSENMIRYEDIDTEMSR